MSKHQFGGTYDGRRFAALLEAAIGPDRNTSTFARVCGVNQATLSRILSAKNKGPSSQAILRAIADNACPNSGVTYELLLVANGYTQDIHSLFLPELARYSLGTANLVQCLIEAVKQKISNKRGSMWIGVAGYELRPGKIHKPSLLLTTDLLGASPDGIWLIDLIHKEEDVCNAVQRYLELYCYIHLTCPRTRPTRYSIAFFEKDDFELATQQYGQINIELPLSFILVDPVNMRVVAETPLSAIKPIID